jgi:hypothetical protein
MGAGGDLCLEGVLLCGNKHAVDNTIYCCWFGARCQDQQSSNMFASSQMRELFEFKWLTCFYVACGADKQHAAWCKQQACTAARTVAHMRSKRKFNVIV